MVYGFALVCGWGLTAALIALVWINGHRGHGLLSGLLIGIVGGLFWPVTLWVALGTVLYRRAAGRSGTSPQTPETFDAQVQQAEAFARQAELENMPTSAQYWRAESQRLTAQRHSSGTHNSRPAATGRIVVGGTVASLVTIGALVVTAPTLATAPITSTNLPIAAAPVADPPAITIPDSAPAPEARTTPSKTYTYRIEGNYRATAVNYTASNGDAVTLNNTGNINTMGTALPWTLTVNAEPNGGLNNLAASTISNKGDSQMTCTITDDAGKLVATNIKRGAYAACFASTMGVAR
jgi:hypothetical protein